MSTTDTDTCSPGESSRHVSGGRGGDRHGETDHREWMEKHIPCFVIRHKWRTEKDQV